MAVDADLTAVTTLDAHDDLEEGRFAGAVAAAEGVHGAGLEAEASVREGDHAVERFAEVGDLHQRDHHRLSPLRVRSHLKRTFRRLCTDVNAG